jgi:hypothetical protein
MWENAGRCCRYKAVVDDNLPNMNFLTALDRFIVTQLAFILLVIAQNTAVYKCPSYMQHAWPNIYGGGHNGHDDIDGRDNAERVCEAVDTTCFRTLLVLWAAFHIRVTMWAVAAAKIPPTPTAVSVDLNFNGMHGF